jgi:hypothetical protein
MVHLRRLAKAAHRTDLDHCNHRLGRLLSLGFSSIAKDLITFMNQNPKNNLREASNRAFRFKDPSVDKAGCSLQLLWCERSVIPAVSSHGAINTRQLSLRDCLTHTRSPRRQVCPTKRHPLAPSTVERRRSPLLSLPMSR